MLKNHEESKCINCNQCFQIYKNKYKRCVFDSKINSQLYKNYHKDQLKLRSSLCGNKKIYDGTFSHDVIDGDWVTAELLKKNVLDNIN